MVTPISWQKDKAVNVQNDLEIVIPGRGLLPASPESITLAAEYGFRARARARPGMTLMDWSVSFTILREAPNVEIARRNRSRKRPRRSTRRGDRPAQFPGFGRSCRCRRHRADT